MNIYKNFETYQIWSWSNLRVAISSLQSHERRIQGAQDEKHSVNRGAHWPSCSFKTQPYKTRRMPMVGRRDEQKLRSDASVHRTGAIRPGGMLRIGFTKFHYGTTCCRLTRSLPPPPPALNSPDKAVIGCLRIYWGRSLPMEMRNIIAFRCSITGCGIAARPNAVFTFSTLRTRMRANRLHRLQHSWPAYSLPFSLFLYLSIWKDPFFPKRQKYRIGRFSAQIIRSPNADGKCAYLSATKSMYLNLRLCSAAMNAKRPLHYVTEILRNYVPQCASIVVIALNTITFARITRSDWNYAKLMRATDVKFSTWAKLSLTRYFWFIDRRCPIDR